MNRLSRLFQPLAFVPKDAILKGKDVTSRSQKVNTQFQMHRNF